MCSGAARALHGFSDLKSVTRAAKTLLFGWLCAVPGQVGAAKAARPGIIYSNVQGRAQTPMSPPQTVNGGSVQQGLSAAYAIFAFCLHRLAADKRYSFDLNSFLDGSKPCAKTRKSRYLYSGAGLLNFLAAAVVFFSWVSNCLNNL